MHPFDESHPRITSNRVRNRFAADSGRNFPILTLSNLHIFKSGMKATSTLYYRQILLGGLMYLLAMLLMLSITACATTPLTIKQASIVPASRVLAPQWLTRTSSSGSLIVKRDSGFMGSACTIRVFLDAAPVA